MANIKKSTNNKCWQGCRKREPCTLLVEMQIDATTVENSIEILQKKKKEPPYDPEIPLLGIYLKKTKALVQKDTCTPMFIAALFTIAKLWKQPNVHQQMNG